MKIEQIYTPSLAQASYYVESDGEAAVVDPIRDIETYLELAGRGGARIKYVFVTHIHADFVSGHLDLARRTGAAIVFGPGAKTAYVKHEAADGETFLVGDLVIKALHTPGHTLESTCFMVSTQAGEPYCLFTGDTLFVGDVGRPDIVQAEAFSTQEDMANLLYESLQAKLLPLPDDVIVYPGHGQGSACGRHIGSERFSTIGAQKKTNAAFLSENRRELIDQLTAPREPAPHYFSRNAALNRNGYQDLQSVRKKARRRLSVEAVNRGVEQGVVLLDIRAPAEFSAGHIPGSINIGIDGMFAVWAATLIADDRLPMIIVGPEARVDEAVVHLARVGIDCVEGFLDTSSAQWRLVGHEFERLQEVSARQFAKLCDTDSLNILDCRTPTEFAGMHVEGARLLPLNMINQHLHLLDTAKTYYIHCKSGYRSTAAASIMRKRGFDHVINIPEGFDALLNTSVRKSSTAESPSR
jgi:glyoxylase-like metal-dependent hydrolase (beta-lactamase superfamily II)/rhodanese-related sulfurtransferase